MSQDKSLETYYSNAIDAKKYNPDLWQKLIRKTERSTVQFYFIDLSQWILLLSLNLICLGFVMFTCNLIR